MPYRKEIVRQLERHGVRPAPGTPPGLVHAYLGALHRYEIRRLKSAMLGGRFPKAEYASRVAALRDRYWLLSFPVQHWLEPEP